MSLDFSIDRINKILEKQKSDFRVVPKEKSVCSVCLEDIKNNKIKEINNKFFNELKEI